MISCPVCPHLKTFFSKFSSTPKEMLHEDYTNGKLLIGKGFKLEDIKMKKFIEINQEVRNRDVHTLILGASGVGKSKLIEHSIVEDIKAGRNVIVIDPKGGGDLFSRITSATTGVGRLSDLMYCSPIFSDISIDINPLANYYMPEEIVTVLLSSVAHEDEFFFNAAKETANIIVRSIILLRQIDRNSSPITIGEIGKYVYFDGFSSLIEEIEDLEESQERTQILIPAKSKIRAGIENFEKVIGSLRIAITEMTTGATGKIIGNVKTNKFIDRIERGEGVILYVQTGAMMVAETSNTISRIITSMIQSVAGRHDSSGIKLQRPLVYYGDEFSNIVYYGIEDLFNKGRSAGVWMNAATQSLADIDAQIGKDRTRKLIENTSTKIIMKQNDLESATYVSRFGGLKKTYSPMISLGGGLTNREVEEELIKPEDIMRLKNREFYYFGFEGQFKGKSVPLNPPEVRVIMPKITSRIEH